MPTILSNHRTCRECCFQNEDTLANASAQSLREEAEMHRVAAQIHKKAFDAYRKVPLYGMQDALRENRQQNEHLTAAKNLEDRAVQRRIEEAQIPVATEEQLKAANDARILAWMNGTF